MALKLLVDGEKSLDLLLTILVCMTWALYFTSGKQFLGILGGLARSLISDLRFDKPQGPCWCPSVGPNAEDKIARTNESRRAHVACFALSVMIGATFPYEMMQWSPQLEIDCDQLVSEKESEGDSLLVSLARISRICHQAAEVSRHLSNNSSSGTHTALHIAPLIASLDRLRSTFSEDQLRHESVTAYITTTEVVIYELALIHPSNQIARSSSMLDHRRTDYLMACFQACKSCTELFSAYGLVSSTTPTNVIIAYGLKVLHRLATLDDPGWDPTIVHQAVDIVGLLERCAAIAEEANAKLKAELGEDSVFLLAAQQLRNSAPNWSLPSQQPHTRDSTMEGWTSEALDLPSIDFSDEFWLNATFNL
ncbi:hypothetical protein CC86DRAFT_287082 [Ophiobolus disseminans]|uniref:Transcription factor domain-containing protein n=1 Tax=Ophiobolus disseminans TaxID=1469910 RepID=A0A6A7A8C8_9PLEO|nr:hypothetical protein CC86DRAFT_287082 [Ophiobolus disseminans]